MATIAGVGRKDVSNLIRDRSATLREIAFIDRNVDDLKTLLAGLRPELDPILLSDDEPALRQMSRLVRDWDELEAIHVIAHGRVGEVSFGAGALPLESLAGHAADLRAIGQALGNDGKLLLWSCDTAAGARGSAFLEALESATGAEVCAATGTIGSQPLGGRWELDVSSGTVAAPLTAQGMAGYAGVLAPQQKASLTAITTDSGTSGDFITNDNTLIFSGTESGISTLGIWISGGIYGIGNGGKGTLIGTVPTDSRQKSSSWSFNYAGTALADGTYTVSLTVGSASGASALSTQTITIDTVPPTISSIAASGSGITSGNGNLNAGKVVTLTVAFSEAVTVNSSGGTPRLALNDSGVATYTGGSGSNSLTFSYTVAAGQNTSDLTVTAFNLNGATVRDGAGNDANLAGAVTNPSGILIIDTVAPGVPIISQVTDDVLPVTGVVANGGSTDDTTPTVRISLSGTNAAAGDQVQLFNGTSALGSAIVLTSGNISNGFVDITTAALAQGTYNFNVRITDVAGNTSGASSNYTVTIATGADTTPPTVSSVVASGAGITNGNGNLNAGKVVTLTVAFSEAVTVNSSGGTPRLALNDSGVATYTGGSGSNSLTFSYTVAAGENTSDLTVTAFNLNGATVRDGAGNDANLAGAVTNPSGILIIDTVAPGVPIISQVTDDVLPVTGVVANGGSTDDTTPTVRISLSGTNAAAGDQVQLFNGTSALGSAIVLTSGNISNGFVDITTAALAQGTYNFNVKITDVAGNTSGASSNYTVTIATGADTTPPTVSSVVASGAGITNGNGNLNAGKVVTLTVAFSEAVTVNTGPPGQEPTFTVNGSAINTASHVYTVTPNAGDQHGSVVSDVRVDLTKTFDITFDINVGNNDNGADGMAFVLHNDPLGDQALGGLGGNLGMFGIKNGVGIEFDTYQNAGAPNDIANDHTNFDNTGVLYNANNAALSPVMDLGNIEDGQWHQVHVVSDGQTISYTFDGVQMSSLSLATAESYLTSQYAYFGFTGGTGGLSEQEQVRLDALAATTENGARLQIGSTWTPLALNDSGVATYTGGSGSNSLTFSYTVAAGQNTSDLTVTAFNLNGATVRDGAGNDANLAGAVTNPSGILIIDTVAPGVPIISQVTDDVLPVTGVVANGGSTDDTTPTVRISLSGTNAAAGDQVQLFNGTSALGSAIVLTSGNISNGFVDITTAALAQGTYNFNARITDVAGNTSGASSNYTVTIGTPRDVGSWSAVFPWPLIGLHCIMTPDGKILTYGTDPNGVQSGLHILDIWNPATNTHTIIDNTTHTDEFCSVGLIVPETGQVMISGGDARPVGNYNGGVQDVNFYDPATMTENPSSTGAMQFARWYASAVQLGTGQILLIGGRDDNPDLAHYSAYAEVYTPGYGFHTLTGAYIDAFNTSALYPRTWLTSSGMVWTSDGTNIYSINPTGVGSVQRIGQAPTQIQFNMPAIMFAPDKVLLIGADDSAWIMDMSGSTPVFQRTDNVTGGRIWSNLVVLPDGRVMISGGSAVDNQLTGVDNTAAIWDPSTGHWTIEADAAIPRLYHSDTILLADGSVLSLGGGAPGPLTNLNGEEYKPGYLFDVTGAPAVRPVIEDAPAQVQPGTEFTMHVDNPASITTLALMPFGAVTHSFDMSARRLELPFTVQADGSLKVDLPANSNLLTPGYWMLFAINNNDVPSIASTVQVKTDPMLYDLPAQRPLDLLDANMVLQRNGDAAYDAYNDRYVLTPDAPTKHGSFISPKRVDLSTAFDISFQINLGGKDAGGDGVGFVLENDPAGINAIGAAGGGQGLTGIQYGLGITFATNAATDQTGFVKTADGSAQSVAVGLGNIEDGQWHQVYVVSNGQTISYTFDGVQMGAISLAAAKALLNGSNLAYFGFTGDTSAATEQEQIQLLKLDATAEGGQQIHLDRANLPPGPLRPNKDPIAVNDAYTINKNGVLTISAAAGVLANDYDPDGDPLRICPESRIVGHALLLAPTNGAVTMNADGSFTYTPNPGFAGVDSFYYCNEDGPACAQGRVDITVTGTATPINTILGTSADDVLVGTAGNDWMSGLAGNDRLTGGRGNDTFVFAPGYGNDTITDFSRARGNRDIIDLSAFNFASFTDVLNRVVVNGADTVFNFGNGDTLTVQNTAAGNVTNLLVDDFKLSSASPVSTSPSTWTANQPVVILSNGESGNFTITDNVELEVVGASTVNVSFASGSTGELKLDASSQFTGQVTGFTDKNLLDLADIALGSNTTLGYVANSNNTGGTLKVSDGTNTANIALLGQYTAASFVMATDGSGGTLIHDPPATLAQTLAQPQQA